MDHLYGDEFKQHCKWSDYTQARGFACTTRLGWKPASEFGSSCYCNRLMVKAMMSVLDEGIGNITQTLRETGQFNNTILTFMGDNGGPHFESHSNLPLRGGKKTWW